MSVNIAKCIVDDLAKALGDGWRAGVEIRFGKELPPTEDGPRNGPKDIPCEAIFILPLPSAPPSFCVGGGTPIQTMGFRFMIRARGGQVSRAFDLACRVLRSLTGAIFKKDFFLVEPTSGTPSSLRDERFEKFIVDANFHFKE